MTNDWVDWFPIVFLPLKIIVLGIAAFFAIKWHHDQDKAKKQSEASATQAPVERAPDAAE